MLALIAAVVSIGVKEGLYWYTIAAAKRIRSVSLKAEAWHHRSDALSSIGSFAGVLGARLGLPILDPIASIVICLFIFKVAYGIFHESIDRLVDRACDPDTVAAMRETLYLLGAGEENSFGSSQHGVGLVSAQMVNRSSLGPVRRR